MRYGSVCSGIEAATVAWKPIGWTAAFFAEIEPFPRAVLKHRYPDVALHGDFTTIGSEDYGAIDLLVGGTPCQSFSVAGLRGGLDDERGNLALEFLRLADRKRPRWLVWENVPGVLSSNGGRDFGSILGGLVELGYGFAYRVLDAQFFGVPQRRRRVFVVGYFGNARHAAAVLFERHSLSGHPSPRRQAGAIASALTRNGVGGGGGADDNAGQANHLIAGTPAAYAGRNQIEQTYVALTLRAEGFDASEDGTGRGVPLVAAIQFDPMQCTAPTYRGQPKPLSEPSHTLHIGGPPAIAFGAQVESPFLEEVALTVTARNGDAGMVDFQCQGTSVGEMGTLRKGNGNVTGGVPFIATSAVRRLTPRECERLQGFPDDYTAVPYRKKPAADGPRYRALGNSMAVPCMEWIGERIAAVETMGLDHGESD